MTTERDMSGPPPIGAWSIDQCEGYDYPAPRRRVRCDEPATWESMVNGQVFCSAHKGWGGGHVRKMVAGKRYYNATKWRRRQRKV